MVERVRTAQLRRPNQGVVAIRSTDRVPAGGSWLVLNLDASPGTPDQSQSPAVAPAPQETAQVQTMLGQLDWSLVAAWVTAAITLVGVLTALIGVWWQLRRQWLLNSASMVTSFADRFDSDEWRLYRVHSALAVQKHRDGELVEVTSELQVLPFFENLGLLVRRGVLDKEMVWNKFGWFVTRYYLALTSPKDVLEAHRSKERDHTLWEEFAWLNKAMLKQYRRRGVSIADSVNPSDRVQELLDQERGLTNLIRPTPRGRVVIHDHR